MEHGNRPGTNEELKETILAERAERASRKDPSGIRPEDMPKQHDVVGPGSAVDLTHGKTIVGDTETNR